MTTNALGSAGPRTEKFSASAGRWLGIVAAVMGLALAAGAGSEGIQAHWRLASFGLAFALLAWAVMIRPSVAAHEHGLVLHNIAHDSFVPWSSIERCKSLQTLQVATPEGIVHGLGVSRSAQSMMRQERGSRTVIGSMFSGGLGMRNAPSGRANEEVRTTATYADMVESRILNLAEAAKGPPQPVVTSLAPLSVAALSGTAVLALVALVV